MIDGITRSQPCPECGAGIIWTQNAWPADGSAAYRCINGHVLDPATTRQCPKCGVHDTKMLSDVDGRQEFRCEQCGEQFAMPR